MIVVANNQIWGIVTDRDIVVRTVAEMRDPATTTLAASAAHALTTVRPDDKYRAGGAPACGRESHCRLPVVAGQRAVQIVSLGDLARERDPESALGAISATPPNT